jgi:hypothetical protein
MALGIGLRSDLDLDGDADLADFSRLQIVFMSQ